MFATTMDVETRWPEGAQFPDPLLRAKLYDAGVILRAFYPSIPDEPGDQLLDVLVMLSVSMVKRAILGDENRGRSQQQFTAGPMSKSTSFRNPDGDMFLTGQERVMLESVLEDGVSNGARGMEAAGW